MALAFAARADELSDKVAQGNELLRQRQYDAAFDLFEDLRRRHPDSPEVQFGIGAAEYHRALEAAGEDTTATMNGFKAAESAFEKAAAAGTGDFRIDAEYNRATALAQQAKQLAALPTTDRKAVEEAFGHSIRAFEDVLHSQPDHSRSQHNLDHMRYTLKRILQNPPPPQQQPQQGKDNPQQQQNPQENQDPQQSPQGGESEDSQDPQSGEQGDRQEQSRSEEGEQDDSSEQEPNEQQPRDGDRQPESSQAPTQQRAILGEPPQGRENVEAILESLETRDQEEQAEIRKGPRDTSIRKEWW
jgi:Mg-chelatase subunit ChlI